MKLIISKEIREKYPDLRIGVVVAKGIDNITYRENLEEFCKKTFEEFSKRFESVKDLEKEKNITAWREIYRSFGINPKKKKPTAESLLARVVKNGFIPHISPAVDAYLCAETINFLPIGGYDLTKIEGDIVLRIANSDERFIGVGADTEEYTVEGEVIYADSDRVLTRCWNYKDCDYAKIDADTQMIALFSEGPVKEISDEEINSTIEMIANNLKMFCNATCEIMFLDVNMECIEIL